VKSWFLKPYSSKGFRNHNSDKRTHLKDKGGLKLSRKLTLEEQEELQQNLNMRKNLSEEALAYSVHVQRLDKEKESLRKRFFEILDDAKRG